ncbi:hypothetical protein N7454_000415 [Penicillium verhagenii]|nr:hypothetical protein N7454_000415 [Penicillium verhagenii]
MSQNNLRRPFRLNVQNQSSVAAFSASQSIDGSGFAKGSVPTGMVRLDRALDNTAAAQGRHGGLLRGQITEVYGPPGVGKTSLALTVASTTLRRGGKVVWIDTSSPIPMGRLKAMTPSEFLPNLIHMRTPTLPHLMAVLAHPPNGFPPQGTDVIIVDSVSSVFPPYFINASELKDRHAKGKITDKLQLQFLLNRRWNVTSELASHLAALSNRGMAVLAINQTHTKIKGLPRATLQPLLSSGGWDKIVLSRIVMYRDFPDRRYMEITKRGGKWFPVRMSETVISFEIGKDGLRQPSEVVDLQERLARLRNAVPLRQSQATPPRPVPTTSTQTRHLQPTPTRMMSILPPSTQPTPAQTAPIQPTPIQPTPTLKRKAPDEIADSQDEESDEYD